MYTVDEADYAILSQVKNQEFAAEVAKIQNRRGEEIREKLQSEQKTMQLTARK